ncbi:MAG: arsenite methyltransferase [Ignavibacteriaceae bacterium]|jgi:SAM-dependent methyltransferase|nr:arsenite methyltransferase [Ignavibacteriaceae bacterium]MCW8812960.1 arsenite methyltransferase [Chlorobium sp.]MCW8817489.1 arsenite methyltransferase [Ignavibacteriaceae bacterium]MCW8996205.1 arsenite methyltransferase [Psychromonas sp.]MCW9096838.1 arsenite methyltransferase [Ignavibacteriaceae bacterium]
MTSSEEIKQVVKEKYGEIAAKNQQGCGCGCNSSKIVGYTIMEDEYDHLDGYVADADLGLGCGVPTEYAGLKKGDTVVDLGSGAGNDVFVARSIVGDDGKVIGIDFTEEMINKAILNKSKVGFTNVDFKLGEIENIPLENNLADVVISNCVLNLVPDKQKAFSEIFRILKPGAHFCVSDIVLKGELPAGLRKSAEMYAGCVAGALQQEEYLGVIKETGFTDIEIKRTKLIELPDDVLKEYLNETEIEKFKQNKIGIYSITVVGYKN